MAVELCSENCCGVSSSSISPRISFSHDFSQSDFIPVEQQQQNPFGGSDPSSSSSDHNLNQKNDNDFDFCVTESFDLESFPAADEFFSDGRILPTQVKTSSKNNNSSSIILKQKGHQLSAPTQQHPPPLPPPPCVNNNHHHHHQNSKNLKKESYKEGKCGLNNDELVCDSKQSSYSSNNSKSSFWSFRRSSSCGNGSYRRSSLCPLPLLSRSNSTGSTSPEYFKRNSLSKEGSNSNSSKHHQNSHKYSSSRCSSPSLGPNIYQKPPLNYNKIHHGSYGNNSVRVSPVLNVHSANLFGLGSIFNNKDKSKKK